MTDNPISNNAGGNGNAPPAAPPPPALADLGDMAKVPMSTRVQAAAQFIKSGFDAADVYKKLGVPPPAAPVPPPAATDVERAHMPMDQEVSEADKNALIDGLRDFSAGGLPAEIVNPAEVSESDQRTATSWKAAQLNDPKFRAAYLSGDATARKQMLAANMILSKPVIPDAAWQAKYGKPS